MLSEKMNYPDFIPKYSNDNCEVFSIKGKYGIGTFTSYKIFRGIYIVYNDFNMSECFSTFVGDENMFCIDYCKEGRIEWTYYDKEYIYLKERDVHITTRTYHGKRFGFPLQRYKGLSILFYVNEANESIKTALEEFNLDLYELRDKFCKNSKGFIIREKSSIDHVFQELYEVDDTIKIPYIKIKILELLLFFKQLDIEEGEKVVPYFNKIQVEKVKAISKFMVDNIECHYTIEELSKRFNFPMTSMKRCFKGVYGNSIYNYIRAYRINKASLLIKDTNKNIADIAILVGYDNASKFSAAFKSVIGTTPLKYRKNID